VTLHAITQVPGAFVLITDAGTLTICWPSGKRTQAAQMPVLTGAAR
jgi:hypothetical protein